MNETSTIKDELDKLAQQIYERTFGNKVRDYVVIETHGYSRVTIEVVGYKYAYSKEK